MFFFILISIATLVTRFVDTLALRRHSSWPFAMRWGMAATLIFFGVDHLVTPERYLPMVPEVVPFHPEIVLLTGLCEIAGALGLLIPRARRLAGIMLAIYFVCVFPANIKNALQGVDVEGLPTVSWYYWLRLPFQPLAIWWALRASEVLQTNLPKKGRRSEQETLA